MGSSVMTDLIVRDYTNNECAFLTITIFLVCDSKTNKDGLQMQL